MPDIDDRCRLVLIAPDIADEKEMANSVGEALQGGDVASLILPQYGLAEHAFQTVAEALAPLTARSGVALMIAGDSRIAGRARADGIHISEGSDALRDAIDKFSPKLIVGAGGIKDRHNALEAGEARPDYVFFGRIDGDIKPEAHDKVLALAEWWAALVEIPCIAMGGHAIASALDVAATGAEFVAMRRAVFEDPRGPAAAVAEVNALFAEKAPRFPV